MEKVYFLLTILVTLLSATIFAQQNTYVFVHGAWGGGWSFKKVDSIMRAKGNNVYRVTLTGLGERSHLGSPDITIQTNVLDVVNTVLYEDLHNIILVGHSFGGAVITGVADSIPGRIKQLIYLDAIVPNDGESVITSRTDGKKGPEHESTDGFVIPNWISKDDPLLHPPGKMEKLACPGTACYLYLHSRRPKAPGERPLLLFCPTGKATGLEGGYHAGRP